MFRHLFFLFFLEHSMDIRDIDFSDLKPSEREIEIKHPVTEEPLGLRFRIMSFDDDRMKRVRRQLRDKNISLSRKSKAFSAAEEEENANLLMFTAILGWEWHGDMLNRTNGEGMDFNQRNFNYVVNELVIVRNQLLEVFNEDKDFFTI